MNVTEVFEKMKNRMEEGVKKYGEFNPATDDRDFQDEINNELIDVLNYLNMFKAQVAMGAIKFGYNFNENDFEDLNVLRHSIMYYFERSEK